MANRVLTFVTETSPRRIAPDRAEPRRIEERDRVELLADVVGDDEVTVPAGSVGTVVAIWAGGAAFEAPHGIKHYFEGPLLSPDGRSPSIRSVWQVDYDGDGRTAKFVTIRPVARPVEGPGSDAVRYRAGRHRHEDASQAACRKAYVAQVCLRARVAPRDCPPITAPAAPARRTAPPPPPPGTALWPCSRIPAARRPDPNRARCRRRPGRACGRP